MYAKLDAYVTIIRVVMAITNVRGFNEPTAAAGRRPSPKRAIASVSFPYTEMAIVIAVKGFVFIHVTYADACQQR